MKRTSLILITMWLSTTFFAYSQVELQDRKFLNNLGVSIKASPFLGYGLDVSTAIHKKLILRAGLNLTKGISFGEFNFELDEAEELEESFGYTPDFCVKPVIDFTHGNLLLDYHPHGIFHFTAGFFVGSTKVGAKGYFADSNGKNSVLLPGKNWPSIEIDDNNSIEMKDGKAEVGLRIGRPLKPYFGFGLGRAVPKKRISFKFEMGVLYHGNSYEVKQNNKVFDLSRSTQEEFRDIDDLLKEPYFGFWPQINFQLSYRIF